MTTPPDSGARPTGSHMVILCGTTSTRNGSHSARRPTDRNRRGYGGTATIWEVARERRLMTIQLHDPSDENYTVQDIAFSPDGRLLATGDSETQVRFWQVDSGREYGKPITNLEIVNAVTFSPDGTLVAAGLADRTVHIWNVRTGQPYGPVLRGHTNQVESIDFSPDGKLLASAEMIGLFGSGIPPRASRTDYRSWHMRTSSGRWRSARRPDACHR